MVQYLGTLWILLTNLFELELPILMNKRILCVIVLLSQAVKAILDWLRLFDSTSFYVTLITMTITDIGYIVMIIFIIQVYIGSAMYMLQLNVGFGEDSDIIEPIFGLSIVDTTLNQYMLMLGEFNMDGFKNHVNNGMCYMIFLGSTFITQITFLNMLIAIMGDTFDKVMSQRPTYSLKNKLKLMADMKSTINILSRRKNDDDYKCYLYVI